MKGLFAVIAIMTDFMASAPKLVIVALLGGAAAVVCTMCAYCCWCHKPHEDVEDSDDEGEGGSARGPAAFKAKPPEPLSEREKQQLQPRGDENHIELATQQAVQHGLRPEDGWC